MATEPTVVGQWNPDAVGAALAVATIFALALAYQIGLWTSDYNWRQEASHLGFSEFNRKTGEWQWNVDVIKTAKAMKQVAETKAGQ